MPQRFLLPALFFFSGAAGLIFESIWCRQLSLLLGCTITSSALVTGVFLLGLGFGALLGERLSRGRNLLRTFSLLETAVAVSGLLVAALLPHTGPFLSWASSELGGAVTAARLLLCFATIFIPSLAMGATLPVLCALLSERWGSHFLTSLAKLYAANTLGAVAGVLICDGLLIPELGLFKSAVIAASLDLSVALAALALGRRSWYSPAKTSPISGSGKQSPFRLRELHWASFGLGVAGSCLQVLWIRILIVFQGSEQWTFSGCLATYLLCLSAGGWLATRLRADGRPQRLVGLFWLASLLAALTLASLPWVRSLANPWLGNLLIIGPTGLALGLAFPWVTAEVKSKVEGAAAATSRTLFANTSGSLVGALLTGLVLIPNFGLQASLMIVSCWLTLVALFLQLRSRLGLASLLLLALQTTAFSLVPRNYLLKLFFPRSDFHYLYSADDNYGSLALVAQQDPNGGEPTLQLMVDGFNMMSNDFCSRRYATGLAAIPCCWQQNPEQVLVICMGLAHSLNTALNHPAVKQVDCVELSPSVIEALRLIPQGKAAQAHEKLKLFLGDGRQHLLRSSKKYQVITLEPPPPVRPGAVNLYTREFFQLCHSRLSDDGVMAQWLPIFQMSRRQTKVIIKAFVEVFPEAYLLEGCGVQLCLIGRKGGGKIAYQKVREQVASFPQLEATGWNQPEFFFSSILAGPQSLAKYTESTPPLTDDWPILQYSWDTWDPDYGALLFGIHNDPMPVEFASGAEEEQVNKGLVALRAQRRFLCQDMVPPEELADYRPRGQLERELMSRQALASYPENAFVRWANQSDGNAEQVLLGQLKQGANSPELRLALARLYFRQGRTLQCQQALATLPKEFAPAAALRCWTLWESGESEKAVEMLQAAKASLSPLDRDFLLQNLK